MALNSFNYVPSNDCKIVYGLLDGDKVFYIGITYSLYSRYTQHINEGPACDYIYWMRLEGRHPSVKIFGMFDVYGQAEEAEHALISLFAQTGHPLCNYHQNPRHNQIVPPRPDRTKRPAKRNGKLLGEMIDKAKKDYLNFRDWELIPLEQRNKTENYEK